jgi:subtilase family serine protease
MKYRRPRILHLATMILLSSLLITMVQLAQAHPSVDARSSESPNQTWLLKKPINKLQALVDSIPLTRDAVPYRAGWPVCLTKSMAPRCYSPLQMRQAYRIQALTRAGITGAGQTIVIIDFYQSPNIRHDLHLFDTLFSLPDPRLTIYAPDGYAPFNINDPAQVGYVYETNLDVEWAHAIAPAANIALVLSRTANDNDVYNATKFAIQNNLGGIISQSFGVPETAETREFLAAEHALFVEAQAKNISVFASSGDTGTLEPIYARNNPHQIIALSPGVNYPASDPLVTSVGGTSLYISPNGCIRETVWSTALGASGGGFSRIFTRPGYQNGIKDIGAHRGIPDVSYSADPALGVPVVISISLAQPLIIPIGGTSAGSPQWAAITALGNQVAGKRLGFLNPELYAVGKSRRLYHRTFFDIVIGVNDFSYTKAGDQIPILGYPAYRGWDAASGLGTPFTSRLLKVLANP